MDKDTLQSIFTFLDRVELKGHREREVMNGIVTALAEEAARQEEPTVEDNG